MRNCIAPAVRGSPLRRSVISALIGNLLNLLNPIVVAKLGPGLLRIGCRRTPGSLARAIRQCGVFTKRPRRDTKRPQRPQRFPTHANATLWAAAKRRTPFTNRTASHLVRPALPVCDDATGIKGNICSPSPAEACNRLPLHRGPAAAPFKTVACRHLGRDLAVAPSRAHEQATDVLVQPRAPPPR